MYIGQIVNIFPKKNYKCVNSVKFNIVFLNLDCLILLLSEIFFIDGSNTILSCIDNSCSD